MAESTDNTRRNISESVPVIFADDVANLAHGSSVTKFYLTRMDPSADGQGESTRTVAAQVIMPLDAFVNMTIFFNHILEGFMENGVVDKGTVETIRSGMEVK